MTKRSGRPFSIKTIVDFLNEKKIFKSFRITYQVVWNLLLIFLVSFISLMLFVGGAGAGFFASLVMDEPIRSKEDMKMDIYNYEEISEIYFANNVYLGDLPSELERREISLDEVSEHLINAIIATEDEYFFEHEGIVPKAIFRATYQEFFSSSIQTGGSTLTQQLIKNQILTSEVSFDRKAAEILLALRLENFFEKDEILEAYLNVVTFGRNANGRNIAGVQAAAQGIFGVDAKDLSIPQAAYIAGLPQSPFGYTPFLPQGRGVKENLEPSLNRMRTVLNRMRDKGYINDKEYDEALNYDIRANLTEPSTSTLEEYPFLLDEVQRRAVEVLATQMMEKDGVTLDEIEDTEKRVAVLSEYRSNARRDLRRNGYEIHTTINKDIYDAHQEVVENNSLFERANDLNEPEEVGAVLIDNKTGAIVSFVGGRDYWREQTNHATKSPFRSNGSTMKSILAYAPAIELGLVQPGFLLADTPMYYRNDPTKQITNWDNRHLGLMTAREALQRSRNVPAVRALNRIPHNYAVETLEKLGFQLERGEPYEPAAIGGIMYGPSVELNTSAYSVFANEGKLKPSYMIEKIVTKDGEVIFQHEHEEIEVFSPQTAYLTLDMLRDVHVSPGTATGLPGMLKFRTDLAGKTGTTNFQHDSWYVGFNPNFTLGVWIGYDTQRPLVGRTGPRTQRIWANLANAAYDINPEFIGASDRFNMPSGIVRQSFCGISGLLPSDLCREAGLVKTDLFISKYVPTKVDDSLERVSFVMLNGEPYRALENTPPEFTQQGISIKEEYFKDTNILEFLPDNWEKIIPDRVADDNGKTPRKMINASISGNKLVWTDHPEKDIVGYRIYGAPNGSDLFTIIDSVRSDEDFSIRLNSQPHAYKITAVDVAGRESDPSDLVIFGEWQKELPLEEEDEEKEDQSNNQPPRNGNNNGNGNGNSNGNGNNNGNGTGNSNGNGNNNGNGNGNSNGNGNNNGNGNGNNDEEEIPDPLEGSAFSPKKSKLSALLFPMFSPINIHKL